jgi:integrase
MRQKSRDPRIKKVGGTYHARFSRKGVRVEQSLDTSNFELALKLVNDIEQAILTGGDYKVVFDLSLRGRGNTPLIGELWPEFIRQKAQGTRKVKKLREKTLREYINFHKRFYSEFWDNKILSEITSDNWISFIEFAQKKSKKGKELKIFNLWKYFSGFCSWCVLTGKMREFPEIFNPDDEDEDGIGKNLSDDELRILREESLYYPSFHLWILMAQFLGMRSGEITQLKKARVHLDRKVIKLSKADTKTNQSRVIPLHPEVLKPLTTQMDSSDSPCVFPNRIDKSRPMDTTGFKKPWNDLRERTNVECRFHDLRHSYATRIFANPNVNPVMAAKALGMSMNTAMKVYIHYTDDQMAVLTKGINL